MRLDTLLKSIFSVIFFIHFLTSSASQWMGNDYLELSNNCMLEGKFEESLEYSNIALQIFTASDATCGIAEAYDQMGVANHKSYNYDIALEYYFKGIHHSQGQYPEIDFQLYNGVAQAYRRLGEWDSAAHYFEKAIELEEYTSELKQGIVYTNLGVLHTNLKNYPQAKYYLRKGYNKARKDGYYAGMGRFYLFYGNTIYRECQSDSILYYTEKGMEIAQQLQIHELKSSLILNLVFYHKGQQNYLTALEYLKQCQALCKQHSFTSNLQRCLREAENIYQSMGNYEAAYLNHKQWRAIEDSMSYKEMQTKARMIQTRHQFQNRERDLKLQILKEHTEAESERQHKQMIAIISTTLLLFIGISFYFIYFQQKHRNQLTEQKTQLLNAELEKKNRNLISKMMYLSQKNGILEETTFHLKKIGHYLPGEQKKEMKSIILHLKNSTDSSFWSEIEYYFTEVHKDFFKNLLLQHPNLTNNEKKLCIFLKLNLSTKEIARITLKTPSSIEKARSRLRAKLNLSSSHTLSTYLEQF